MSDEVETVDQAPVQSMEDRVARSLGFPTGKNTPAEPAEAVETQPTGNEFADVEWEGILLKAPADKAQTVKDALMRQADYTQKTQAVADKQRALDQRLEQIQAQGAETYFNESVKSELTDLAMIDAYLASSKNVDWASMSSDQMMRTKIELDGVKERRAELMQSIAAKRAAFDNDLKAKLGELKSKAKDATSKSIPNFTEQTEKEIRSYAESAGYTEREIDNILLDPRSTRSLYEAAQFRKVQSGTQAATEKATKANPVLKPGAASDRMPAEKVAELNFRKAQKNARTSSEKARNIEAYLQGKFG